MRMPYMQEKNSNGFNRPQTATKGNPFDGTSEMDIRALTERVLDDDRNIGYVTSEGQVMPRNTAFENGYKNGIELVKQRVWGYDPNADLDSGEKSDPELDMGAGTTSPQNLPDVEVIFSENAQRSIAQESLRSEDVETGGALIGSWERSVDGDVKIYVERATGPGPDAMQRLSLFSPNLEYYRSRVGYYREIHHWDYLGEWHKHPGSFNTLSSTDTDTAHSLICEEGWPLLLLPIVTSANGQLFLDNNLILSPQLGGRTLLHIDKMNFDSLCLVETVKIYLDSQVIDSFRESGEQSSSLEGIVNPGESYVFIPIPGLKNAELRLVKALTGNIPITAENSVVTAIVTEEGVHCYHVNEGEIVSVESILIDSANTIYERNVGLSETTALKGKTITIVGCGSLGSTLALSLARAGVGTFYLFDFDRLSPANIARHQANLSDLGRNKTAVLRDMIHRINPTLQVSINNLDIVNDTKGFQTFKEAASESDLLICTTDTDDSRMLVNSVAVEQSVKAIQAGLHERAVSGLIHLYDPETEYACFACHRNRLLSESSKRAEHIAYSDATDIRALTIQPGLAAQINLIAEIAALRAIDALMDRHSLPELTLVYVDKEGPAGEENSPEQCRQLQLRVVHLDLERVHACPVCGDITMDMPVDCKEDVN